ncbi:MAG: LuxR family transcriptional regulator [Kofleriaceae bacterium]|nr:LuxR family transcriptional regulator [Kofleriaceae bacterium]MCB9575048.1 LuxR family transcriptional regulator [Kofleriaceae bacterium]
MLVMIGIAVIVGADVVSDAGAGTGWMHVALEVAAMVGALAGAIALWRQAEHRRRRIGHLEREVQAARGEAEAWKREAGEHLRGLGVAIDAQLTRWQLTGAEREIALLLLKGLSLKEIAGVRETSERTVRQQALAVYRKSGLGGRAELAAFFLEDLLLPGGVPGA